MKVNATLATLFAAAALASCSDKETIPGNAGNYIVTVTPAASVQPEAPDNLLEAFNGASIKEEHHTIMSAVIQKVQLAKSGLTEACTSLLTGFEVRILRHVI